MEIDGLGARCHLPTCRTLDYLPFRCPHCKNQFCPDHQLAAAHACPQAPKPSGQVPTCPLCHAAVSVGHTLTADQAVSLHIDAGCPKRARANPVCSKKQCSKRDVAATKCATCGLVFCLQHRLEMDHECVERKGPVEGRNAFGQKVVGGAKSSGGKIKRGRGEVRADFLNSVANAFGDEKISEEDRVKVAMFFPMGSGVRPRYMFFSRRNSGGKIIDGLKRDVKELKGPTDGGRYCLYAVKSGGGGINLLPHITPLKDLPRGILSNGDVLVLEQGEGGLDQEWSSILAKLAGGNSSAAGRTLLMAAGMRRGQKGNKKMDKCAVA